MFNYIKKNFSTPEPLTEGIPKHFPPAIREWKDSVYSFNKNVTKDTALKDELLYDAMWTHFLSNKKKKNDRRSLRMLGSIKRASSKRIFISKPEIKQTSDKSIVTFYLFDREHQLLKKRIFYMKKLLLKNNRLSSKSTFIENILSNHIKFQKVSAKKRSLKNTINKDTVLNLKIQINKLTDIIKNLKDKVYQDKIVINSIAFFEKKLKKVIVKLNLIKSKKIKVKNNKNIKFKKSISKSKVNYSMLPKYIVPNILRKRSILKSLFLFGFLNWILKHLFKVKTRIYNLCNSCNKKGKRVLCTLSKTNCTNCKKKLTKNRKLFIVISKNNKTIFSANINKFNFNSLNAINVVLSKYLNIFIYNSKDLYQDKIEVDNSYKIIKLFNIYKNLKYKRFIHKFLFKELKMINTLSCLQFNRFKYIDYTSKIKNFIKPLYNKKIELNLVSLKYMHLNSDIFFDSLAVKLRKRKAKLFRVLRLSLNLIKRPYMFFSLLQKRNPLYMEGSLGSENTYKEIRSVFDSNYVNIYSAPSYFNIKTNILNNIKYKWVTGIRLEAKGRLTKRYTASRALFKYIIKGNLENKDRLFIRNYEEKKVNLYRLRNQFDSNLQYTHKFGHRRIGTFGLKGWINSI